MVLMKYHLFFKKLGKMSPNLSTAAVVFGALRVKIYHSSRLEIEYIGKYSPLLSELDTSLFNWVS